MKRQTATDPRLVAGASNTATGEDAQNAMSLALLQLQAEMRKAADLTELGYLIANEARVPLRAQQIVVFAPAASGRLTVHTVSSLTSVDRASPLVQWFESLPEALRSDSNLARIKEFEASAFSGAYDTVQQAYPLRQMLWVPFLSRGRSAGGGMILARATHWTDHETRVASYLAGAFGHAWSALAPPVSTRLMSRLATWRSAAIVSLAAIGLLLAPIPMTALAPVEIGPRETYVVTPGVEGSVKSVAVAPNAEVKTGQLLLSLNDTNQRNRAEIAEREVLVADTKFKKAALLAFVDVRGRHDMAVAKSELDLKLAERDYAQELLKRTEIRSERDGVAFFADPKDLVGRPVAVGEKLMEIADPSSREFRIELPATDAVVLHDGARVKVFLDSDPLNPVEARIVRAAYKAATRDGTQFAFRVVAEAVDAATAQKLRLGMRGTAQIYSDNVPLGFYLFRRPIAVARQWTGL